MHVAVERPTELTTNGELRLGFPVHSLWSYTTTLKRALDLCLGAVFLACSLPVWPLIAVAIMLDSAGPVFLVQERVGLRGRRFRFYKFRSILVREDRSSAEVQPVNEMGGHLFRVRGEPSVTRIGRLLRRTSLDELPQLINVIRGEMSLVGPRPPVPEDVAQYRSSDMVRLGVKPGLTCWWQVRGRSNCDFDTWMAYDREYVYGLSLWVDLVILLRTAWAVLSCRGAR